MEPKGARLPRIAAFLGYQPDTDRFDAAGLIGRILGRLGTTIRQLAAETGICADTLANLGKGRYQPSRRTYEKLKALAAAPST